MQQQAVGPQEIPQSILFLHVQKGRWRYKLLELDRLQDIEAVTCLNGHVLDRNTAGYRIYSPVSMASLFSYLTDADDDDASTDWLSEIGKVTPNLLTEMDAMPREAGFNLCEKNVRIVCFQSKETNRIPQKRVNQLVLFGFIIMCMICLYFLCK
jgi:hypothetical protein